MKLLTAWQKQWQKKARHLPFEMTATKEQIKNVKHYKNEVEDGKTLNQICIRS